MSNLYERIFEILMHRSSLAGRSIKNLGCFCRTVLFLFLFFIQLSIVFVTMQQHIFAIMRTCEMWRTESPNGPETKQRLCNPFRRSQHINLTVSIEWAPNKTQPAYDIDGTSCAHSIFVRVSGLLLFSDCSVRY